jgi:hypothetical protein
MTLAMEEYVLFDPMDVGLFGAVAVMTDADCFLTWSAET